MASGGEARRGAARRGEAKRGETRRGETRASELEAKAERKVKRGVALSEERYGPGRRW